MEAPIITTKEGQLRGKSGKNFLGGTFYSFLGVPYGKAPVGELRFKAPVPMEPWEGIRDATREGPECPSRHMMFIYHIGNEENCLNLNVYTPELPVDDVKLKPVMFWIHGGAFLYGSNKSDFYAPDYLLTEDIVLVCINYRLGVFGFLSLEDASLDVPGNAGMKDMILALQWVQRNIKSFGGDPNNVTIFGESAGSASVHYLYLSPLAKGLFHKAIAQSGSALNSWAQGCSNALEIAKNLGYKETDEKKILEYLKGLPAKKIVEAQHKTLDPFDASTVRPFGPVIEKSSEKAFLCENPINIIKSGRFNDVPLIMGYTSKEGMLFEAARSIHTGAKLTTNFESEIYYQLKLEPRSEKSLEKSSKIREFYFGNEEPTEANIDKIYSMRTDNMFLYGIHKSVSLQKRLSKSSIYFYKMTLESSLNKFKNLCTSRNVYIYMAMCFFAYYFEHGIIKNLFLRLSNLVPNKVQPGVCHADDISYLFKTFLNEQIDPKSTEAMYVRRFVKLWVNFARTGNPTPDEDHELIDITWKPVTKEENCLMNIGTKLAMETDPDLERMEFWDSICNN